MKNNHVNLRIWTKVYKTQLVTITLRVSFGAPLQILQSVAYTLASACFAFKPVINRGIQTGIWGINYVTSGLGVKNI